MIATNPLFDTHAHLSDADLIQQVDEVLRRAKSAGVVGIVAIGTTVESSRACVELAAQFSDVWASVGIHPNHCGGAESDDWEQIQRMVELPRVVAIGETGLDRYWKDTPWATQLDFFRRHIELSQASGLPLVIHSRDCESEMLDAVSTFGKRPLRGIMHSFTGTLEAANAYIDSGLHISFAGMVTFPKSDALRSVASQVPADRLLVETDSPYLSPQPLRGKHPNEPSRIVYTAQCLADCRGVEIAELARETTRNARVLFGVDV